MKKLKFLPLIILFASFGAPKSIDESENGCARFCLSIIEMTEMQKDVFRVKIEYEIPNSEHYSAIIKKGEVYVISEMHLRVVGATYMSIAKGDSSYMKQFDGCLGCNYYCSLLTDHYDGIDRFVGPHIAPNSYHRTYSSSGKRHLNERRFQRETISFNALPNTSFFVLVTAKHYFVSVEGLTVFNDITRLPISEADEKIHKELKKGKYIYDPSFYSISYAIRHNSTAIIDSSYTQSSDTIRYIKSDGTKMTEISKQNNIYIKEASESYCELNFPCSDNY